MKPKDSGGIGSIAGEKKRMTTLSKSKNSLDFNNQIESIDKQSSDGQKRSIHFKSLKNFITHYPHVKKSKITATDLLTEYLALIESNSFSFKEEQSKGAFDLYINPLARIYVRHLSFSSKFSILFNILFYGIPNLGLWMLFHSKILIFSFIPLYLLYWINYIRKYYQKKIYGYRY